MFCMTADFDRMMEAAKVLRNCTTQAEVGVLLGIDENPDQVLTNWKARGLPRARINEISRKIGCNPFWLEDGEGMMEYICATTNTEANVLKAMQNMARYNQPEKIEALVTVSNSLAEQAKHKNGTQ